MERLFDKLGAGETVVDPATVSTAFGDGSDSGMGLDFDGRCPARAIGAKGDQKARAADRAGTREAVEQIVFRVQSKQLGDAFVQLFDGSDESPQLDGGSFRDEAVGFNDSGICGQRARAGNLADAFIDDGIFAAIMTVIKGP